MTLKQIAFITKSTTITALEQYRICSPMGSMGLVLFAGKNQASNLQERINDFCAIVIQRDFSRNFDDFKAVLELGRKNGIPVVLDLDDYLFDLPPRHPMRMTGAFADALLPLLSTILQVDAVTVTTNLMKEILQGINSSIYVLPNYLDSDLWQFRPARETVINGPVRIVFYGTPTHQADFESINEPLILIADKFGKGVEFMFVGTNPPSGLSGRNNVITQPNMIYDYQSYIASINNIEADIAIAPLENNLFNRCKSAIKFFEYASLGIPGIYSSLDPYESVICEGQNGFLAKTTEDWVVALTRLIEDSELRHLMAENAQKDVQQHWLLRDHLGEWKAAYEEICTNRNRQEDKGVNQISAILDLIQIQRSEIETLRANREYRAAKTIVQLRKKNGQLEADLNYHQQLRTQLEASNHQLYGQLISLQEAFNATDLKYDQLTQQEIALMDQEQLHILQLNYLRRERERLASMNNLLQNQNQQLSNELELTKQEVVNYALSRSWNLTRPLRDLKRKLRRS